MRFSSITQSTPDILIPVQGVKILSEMTLALCLAVIGCQLWNILEI